MGIKTCGVMVSDGWHYIRSRDIARAHVVLYCLCLVDDSWARLKQLVRVRFWLCARRWCRQYRLQGVDTAGFLGCVSVTVVSLAMCGGRSCSCSGFGAVKQPPGLMQLHAVGLHDKKCEHLGSDRVLSHVDSYAR